VFDLPAFQTAALSAWTGALSYGIAAGIVGGLLALLGEWLRA
jgi:hypothetical protein